MNYWKGPPITRNANSVDLTLIQAEMEYNIERFSGRTVFLPIHAVVKAHIRQDHSDIDTQPIHIPYTTANRYGEGSL